MGARILIIEDHALLADTLAVALAGRGHVVSRPPSLDSTAILATAEDHVPDLVLLDLDLGLHGDSSPLITELVRRGTRVLVVTGERSKATLGRCIQIGACGVVDKGQPLECLIDAIGNAANGRPMDPSIAQQLLDSFRSHRQENLRRTEPFTRLSRRECQVLDGLMRGRDARTLAEDSFVSIATVRSQIRAVLTKLGVTSQLEAVAAAHAAEWHPDETRA